MSITKLEQYIIKTLAYYQALGNIALTSIEIKKYILEKKDVSRNIFLFDVESSLNHLLDLHIIKQKNGFWTLAEYEHLTENRTKKIKQTALKWKKIRRTCYFLPYIPYIRKISITGSLALNNSTNNSDIDILITNDNNKIWTSRFLVTLTSILLKNRKSQKQRANKLCFSQHISKSETRFGPNRIDTVVKNMQIPIWSQENHPKDSYNSLIYLKNIQLFIFIKKFIELILKLSFLDRIIEILLGKLQILKIQKNSTPYSKELPALSIDSANLIFYNLKVSQTENKYLALLDKYSF